MISGPVKTQFLAAMRRLLRPMVRQLIAYGISYPAFSTLLKQVYLDVAENDFALPFKRQTDSRLSLITGLHRKDVSQLRRKRSPRDRLVAVEDTLLTHLIGRWMAGPPYARADGTPHTLPYESREKGVASFARLVHEAGADVPARSVLDELLRLQTVELLPNGTVVLRQQAYVPQSGIEGKLTLLGSDPAELFSTIIHNIEAPDAPRLQRKVVYDNIGTAALPELRTRAAEVGADFIREANTLLAAHDRDRNPQAPGGTRARVVLGVYYFEEDVEPTPQPADPAPPPGRIRRSS